jgi:hypothetical protein
VPRVPSPPSRPAGAGAELLERAGRTPAEGTHALGHLVDDLIEGLVLRLEELGQIVELRTGDVPVIVARLGVQQELVGQKRIEDVDDLLPTVVGDSDVEAHDGCLSPPFGTPGLPRSVRPAC